MLTFIILFVPLLFHVVASYLFNRNKLQHDLGIILFVSFLEGLFAYLVTVLIVFIGFVNLIWLFMLLVFLLFATGALLFYVQDSLGEDWDLLLETIKNTLTLFFMTFVPLMVGLTIFRFESPMIQVLYAVIFTICIFVVGWLIKSAMKKVYDPLSDYLEHTSASSYLLAAVGFLFVSVFVIFFVGVPKVELSRPLNLNNNMRYFTFFELDPTMRNNLLSEIELEISSEDVPRSILSFVDYIMDEEYLYLLNVNGEVLVYNLSSGERHAMYTIPTEDIGVKPKHVQTLFEVNNEIYALFPDGLWYLTPNSYQLIDEEIADHNAKLYMVNDNEYRILHRDNADIYRSLEVDNREVHMIDLLDEVESTDQITVISNHLFVNDGTHYRLYENPSMHFEILPGEATYNANQQTMLYVEVDRRTTYTAIKSDGEVITKDYFGTFNSKGFVIGDTVYMIPDSEVELGRIEAVSDFIEFNGVHDHYEAERVWFFNQFNRSKVLGYRVEDENLTYFQVDHKDDEILFRQVRVYQEDVALSLPFYRHFSIYIFLPIIIAAFVPITNYREYITILDFTAIIKRK